MTPEEAAVSLNDFHSKTEYKISLTDYKLDLFPMNQSFNGLYVEKLWSADKTRNMFQECSNQYYQYKLISTEANNDDHDQTENNLTSVMIDCHICNLAIPKTDVAEHNNCVKHNICLRLAKESLERINKQLTNQINNDETNTKKKDGYYYYCPSCNLNIKAETRGTHENDTKHKLASKKDKLFSIMLEIYMNDTITDMSCDDLKLEDDDKVTDATFEESFISCSDDDSLKLQATEELLNDDENNPIKKDHCTANTKFVPLTPLKSMKIANDHFKKGISPNKEEFSCDELDGSKYDWTMNEDKEAEQLMSTRTANCEVFSGDYYSLKHVLEDLSHKDHFKITLSNDNQNIFKKANKDNFDNENATCNIISQTKGDLSQTNALMYIHCTVCNVRPAVGNYEAHIKGRRHIKNVKLKAEQELIRANEAVGGIDYATNKTKGNVKPTYSNKIMNSQEISNMQGKEDPNHGTKNQYFCNVCKVNVPLNPNNIAKHNRGLRHMTRQKLTDTENATGNLKINNRAKANASQTTAPTKNILCTLCNVQVGVGNYEQHTNGQKHVEVVKLQAEQRKKKKRKKKPSSLVS